MNGAPPDASAGRRLGCGEMTVVPAGARHRARVESEALVLVFDRL